MIITRTPFRISFLGGGTDYQEWFGQHGGSCLSASIDKYCYISLRNLPPFFQHKYRVVYSKVETVAEASEIRHPSVRAVIQEAGLPEGLEIHHDGDVPARTGLGSSSAFTAGLLLAMEAYRGRVLRRDDLAERAIRLEQEVLQEPVGWQDQICAAHGGFHRIDFQRGGRYEVVPVGASPERLQRFQDHLLLFFTGVSRELKDIAEAKLARYGECEAELERMQALAREGTALLEDEAADLADFGAMLDEDWRCKRAIADRVSTPEIDATYQAGREAGALGGKLLGAGGGGCMLFFAPPASHDAIRQAMGERIEIPFEFDYSGSRVVFFQPGGLGS